ncbi:MAG: carbohydrate kinase family protein [Candidatus Diapherotrites archaeon]
MKSRKKFDVACIGNATEDVFIHIRPRMFRGEVMLTPGRKLEIEDLDVFTGGGGTNCAVGFARLGLRTALLAEVGNDESAGTILRELKREHVSTALILHSKELGTAYSAILTGFGDRIILTYRGATAHLGGDKKINWRALGKAKWFYISSLHKKPSLVRKVVGFAAKHKIKVAWNPGKVEISAGLKKLAPALRHIDVLMVNAEEAALLAKGRNADIIGNMKKIKKYTKGSGLVVVTDGTKAVHVFDGTKMHLGKPFRVKVLDTTGAGDAFNCAFVSALHRGREITGAIDWGCANAASVIQHLGTKNILLTRAGIEKFIRANKKKRLG